jgi:hypothetical protein
MGKIGNTVGSQRIPLVLSETQKAFIAGFLEGDGSISAKISPTPWKRLGYRVRVIISFTQHTRNKEILRYLQKIVGGSLKDYASRSMSELVIFDRKRVEDVLKEILPYLIVKKKQAVLALEIIERFKKRKKHKRSKLSPEDLIEIVKIAEKIRELNSSRRNKIIHNLDRVKQKLEKKDLLTP